MHRQIMVLCVMVIFGAAAGVRADKLILKDGRVLSGKVTVDRDGDTKTYTIETEDGQTSTFTREEVKRYDYQSTLADWEVLEKYEQWQESVRSVLQAPEPNQRQFLTVWRDRLTLQIYGRLWETPPNTDKFVDEWARYTAKFEAVCKSHTYKQLTSPKKGSNSLVDYSRHPPDEREDVAEALKLALKSFKTCSESAKVTNNLVKQLPREDLKQAKRIRSARTTARKAEARRSTAKDHTRRHQQNREFAERAARKNAEVQETIFKARNILEKKIHIADERINEFARERIGE